jgi:hypothetical protein
MAALEDRVSRLEERHRQQSQESAWAKPMRVEMSNEEVVEVGLILLAYVFEGDTEAFAQMLVERNGVCMEDARETAGILGALLEMRRASAPDPARPV